MRVYNEEHFTNEKPHNDVVVIIPWEEMKLIDVCVAAFAKANPRKKRLAKLALDFEKACIY